MVLSTTVLKLAKDGAPPEELKSAHERPIRTMKRTLRQIEDDQQRARLQDRGRNPEARQIMMANGIQDFRVADEMN
jgi:hypothetical protein